MAQFHRDLPNKPKERRKRNTLKIIDDNINISPAVIKRKNISELSEVINVCNDFQPIGERFEQMPSVPDKKVSSAQRPLAYTRISLIQNKQTASSSTFGRVPIVKDDDVDSRTHYATFMNCMDLNDNSIMQKMLYDCDRLRCGDQDQDRGTRMPKYSKKPFHLFMSPTYMKQTFDMDVDSESDYRNMQRFQQEMKNVLTMNLEEMIRYKNGCYLNGILIGTSDNDNDFEDIGIEEDCLGDTADLDTMTDLPSCSAIDSNTDSLLQNGSIDKSIDQSQSCRESMGLQNDESLPVGESTRLQNNGSMTINESQDQSQSFGASTGCQHGSKSDSNIFRCDSHESGILSEIPSHSLEEDPELSQIHSDACVTQVVPISGRNISIDEGLGGSYSSSMSVRSDPMYSPSVELFDIFKGVGKSVSKEDIRNVTVVVDKTMMSNIFGIRTDYLTVVQQFNLPGDMFEREIPLALNILELPEAKLRKKKLFQLPEEFNMWKNTVSVDETDILPPYTDI